MVLILKICHAVPECRQLMVHSLQHGHEVLLLQRGVLLQGCHGVRVVVSMGVLDIPLRDVVVVSRVVGFVGVFLEGVQDPAFKFCHHGDAEHHGDQQHLPHFFVVMKGEGKDLGE